MTVPQARECRGRVITYGRIPLMLTERCFMKDISGCENCSECGLVDRLGVRFPMMREWKHRTLILNSAPTYTADRQDKLSKEGISTQHFIFTTESEGEARRIISAYESCLPYPFSAPFRRIGKREMK